MFFDIGIGLLLSTFVGVTTGSYPSWLWLLIGVTGALWPDADFIVWILRGNKVDHLTHQHRDLLHRPLVLMPLLTTTIWLWLGWQLGLLFGLATLAHFTQDTIGHGWGIRWLWPLDSRYWCCHLFGDQPAKLYRWTKQEQDEICDRFGNHQWMKQSYGGLSRSMIVELIVMTIGTISVVAWFTIFVP